MHLLIPVEWECFKQRVKYEEGGSKLQYPQTTLTTFTLLYFFETNYVFTLVSCVVIYDINYVLKSVFCYNFYNFHYFKE